MERQRLSQIYEGLVISVLLLLTALQNATWLLASAVVLLVLGIVLFPQQRLRGTRAALVGSMATALFALVLRLH